jgi:hypothetical protein
MNEYKVSDYGIFTNAINTTNNLKAKIEDGKTRVGEVNNVISSEATYMGPAAEEAKTGLAKSTQKLSDQSGNFTTIASFLAETSKTYQAGDQAAAENLLNVGDNGQATTLSSIQHNGQLIYYSQRGYYDASGQFHRWQSSWGKDIASSGCGPTSMAACLVNIFHDTSITPSTVASMLNYNDNIGGTYVGKVAQHYGLDQTSKLHLTKEYANNCLRNGGKMIVAVNGGGHYIAVVGINEGNPPTYIVNDPNDSDGQMKSWTFDQLSTGHTMTFYIAPPGKTVQQIVNSGAQTVQV